MSFADDVIRKFDIKDYLGQFGKVMRSGGNQLTMSECPICGDRRKDKFYVRNGGKAHGMWNSYCCHDEGNLVALVAKVEGISEAQAAGVMARIVNGEDAQIEPLFPPSNDEIAKRDPRLPFPTAPASPETPCWIKDHLGTLAERGVTQEIIDHHGLQLTGTQTIYDGKRRYDLDNRLLAPVYGIGDSLWGWQARDLTGQAERKYLFPTGDRSTEWLYDLQNHTSDVLMIVEGVFHKWAWWPFQRIRNSVVASFGKKLTADQIQRILERQHITEVVIAWDLDAAGEIVTAAEKLTGYKRVYVMPSHPSGRDHDELTMLEKHSLINGVRPYDRNLAVELNVTAARMKGRARV